MAKLGSGRFSRRFARASKNDEDVPREEKVSQERTDQGERVDAGSVGDASALSQEANLRESAGAADLDAKSRAESQGIETEAVEEATAGSERVPTSSLGGKVSGGLASEQASLVDPTEMSKDTPNVSGAERAGTSARMGDLRGAATEADSHQSGGQASTAGISEEPEPYYGEGNLDDVELEQEPEPYYGSPDYTTPKGEGPIGDDNVAYVDADSGGEGLSSEQQAEIDAAKGDGFDINNPGTPGNVDPTEFGNETAETRDTSTMDLTNPGSADANDAVSGATKTGSPPPRAGVDYGEDHVDQNPGGGPDNGALDIGLTPNNDTVEFDFAEQDTAESEPVYEEPLETDISSVIDEVSEAMADRFQFGMGDDIIAD